MIQHFTACWPHLIAVSWSKHSARTGSRDSTSFKWVAYGIPNTLKSASTRTRFYHEGAIHEAHSPYFRSFPLAPGRELGCRSASAGCRGDPDAGQRLGAARRTVRHDRDNEERLAFLRVGRYFCSVDRHTRRRRQGFSEGAPHARSADLRAAGDVG